MIRTDLDFINYIAELEQKHAGYFFLNSYTPETILIEQQKNYPWVNIIKKGLAKCYFSDANGRNFIQEFIGKGIQVGELEVFTGQLSFCSIAAITPLEVYKIKKEDYNTLLENDPVFNGLVLKSMALKISYKAPRHSFQHSYSIEKNIIKLKESVPDFDTIFSKKDIANYLGITLRSLNRILSGLG